MKEFTVQGGGERVQVQNRTRQVRIHRCRSRVMQDRGRRANDDHLVLKFFSIGKIRLPKLRNENLVQRLGRVRVGGAEADRIGTRIVRNRIRVAEFRQRPSDQRTCVLFSEKFRFARQFPMSSMKAHSPNYPIRVPPIVYESDAVVLFLWRRNQ